MLRNTHAAIPSFSGFPTLYANIDDFSPSPIVSKDIDLIFSDPGCQGTASSFIDFSIIT